MPNRNDSRSDSEVRLISHLLQEIVPSQHITQELVDGFLAEYRKGGDVTHYLLGRLGTILRRIDSDLSHTQRGADALRGQVDALEQVTIDLKSSLRELDLLEEASFGERGSHHDLEEVLASLMDLLGRCLPVEGMRIFLIDKHSHAFVPAAARNLSGEQERETDDRMEEGTFAWAIREGGPVALPLDPRRGAGRTLVIAPMLVGRLPIGIVCLFAALRDAEYTPHIFQILRGLVRRASVGVANARRYRELERESSRLAAMRDYLELIVDAMMHGVLVVGADDRVTIFNRTAELIFGFERDAVVGRRYAETLPDDLAELLDEILARTRRDDPVVDYEFAYDRGEGVTFRLGVTSALLPPGEGGGRGAVLTFRDLFSARELMRLRLRDRSQAAELTRFRESLEDAEERLRRSEKLASIGQMAAGVAHEINNPLGSIAGFIQLILMDTPAGAAPRSYLEAMSREVERMKGIVEDLLDFSRQKTTPDKTFLPVDINLVVEETVRLAEPQARISRATVDLRLAPDLSPARGLADRLKQVFLNMVLNAFHAMNKEESRLVVQTRAVSGDGGRAWIEVVLSDNGEGIRQEDIPRIFDPFFTTREQGQGTGLGLATAYGIVEQHGGSIHVESVWGEGSSFTVRLPVLSGEETE